MYLLDSDIFSNYRRERFGKTALVERVDQARLAGQCRLSILTVQETLHGATGSVNSFRSRKDMRQLPSALLFLQVAVAEVNAFPILGLDEASMEQAKRLTDGFRKPVKTDLLIAAQALAHDLTVVTRNVRDFSQVPDLKFATWP